MLGRIRRKNTRKDEGAAEPEPEPAGDSSYDYGNEYGDDETYTHVEPQRASEMIGGSGVSLDGQSLILPPDGASSAGQQSLAEYGMSVGGDMQGHDDDDLSSINTSTYNGGMNRQDFITLAKQDRAEADRAGPPEKPEEQPDEENPAPIPVVAKANTNAPADESQNKNSHTSAETDEESEKGGGCLPAWISEAPGWLKVVILISTLLLLGAIVLVGVGAALVASDNGNDNSTTTNSADTPSGSPGFPPVITPAMTPVAQPVAAPVMAPVVAPVEAPVEQPAQPPMDDPVKPPIAVPPTEPPTMAPTEPDATPKPTGMPTASPTETKSPIVTFLVTAGRFLDDARVALRDQQLPSLPDEWDNGNVVMFHLGDWNSPFATGCSEESYLENVALYAQSSVPVYFLVGDNEYNDCPDPDLAFTYWNNNFLGFESEKGLWSPPKAWTIDRQTPDNPENFAYVYKGALMIGINLVGGVIHNQREWRERLNANLRWIDNLYDEHRGEVSTMVILAHSSPIIEVNESFFATFLGRVENDYSDVLVVFIHRNLSTNPWELQPRYNGINNLVVVVVQGSVWPPMKVELDTSTGVIDIEQQDWHDEYLESKP